MPSKLDPKWVTRRQQLQDRFEELHPIRDASHFAYMRGANQRFTEDDIQALWANVAANPTPGTMTPRNHVYVHVPFCKSICSFCNYERLKPSHPNLMKGWFKRVMHSIETLGPTLEPLQWHSLYIGGGTPSTLPADMLDKLLTGLETHLNFHPQAGKHMELDPAVASATRLAVLQRHGFQRLSFGIQSLDAEINTAHNRGAQGRDIVNKCFSDLKEHGFQGVSCDFLLGLKGTTVDEILADIRYVLEHHEPMGIDVFSLVPTKKYIDGTFDGDIDAFWEHMRPFQERIPTELPALAAEFDYRMSDECNHRYTLSRPEGKSRGLKPQFSYTQLACEQQRPLNLIGFGTSARNQIFGQAAFQYRDPDGDPGAEGPAWYEGHNLTFETEVRTYLVHTLRDRGYLDRAQFVGVFGVDVAQVVGVPIAVWQSQGTATLSPERLTLAKLPAAERARMLLWLVPDAQLEFEIGRIESIDLSDRGVSNFFQALPIGTQVAPSYVFGGVERGRMVLQGPDHRIVLRLAPALRKDQPLRVIVETRPPKSASMADISLAVKKLRSMATRVHRARRRSRDAASA